MTAQMSEVAHTAKLSDYEQKELKKRVFNKLEKYARMSKLEKSLGVKEEHLQAWLNAWEGQEVEDEVPPFYDFNQQGNYIQMH